MSNIEVNKMTDVKKQAVMRQVSLIGYRDDNGKFNFYEGELPEGKELMVLVVGFNVYDLLTIATPIEILDGEKKDKILSPRKRSTRERKKELIDLDISL